MRAEGDLAASNYYGRFVSMLGSDPLDEDVKHRVFRGFAESSGDFWRPQRRLEERPDVRGLPTAFAFDHRTYVGPALSQALVRDSDRRALLRLLAVAGLRPGQTVAADDMARLLEERLPDAPLSAGLKRLAASPEALGRIAEVACVELAAWSGGAEEADAGAGGRVALQASVRRLPRRSLRLGVAVAAPPQVTSLAPGPDCDEAGRSALAAAGGTVGLQSPDPDGWRALSGPLGIADLLASRLELVAEHGFRAHRRPLPVVALAREEQATSTARLTASRSPPSTCSSRCSPRGSASTGSSSPSPARATGSTSSLPRPAAGLAALRGRRDRRHQRHLGAGPGGARPAGLGRDIARPGNEVARQVDLARTRRAGAEGHGPAGTDDRGAALGAGEQTHELGSFEGALIADLDELELEDGDYRAELLEPDDDRVLGTVAMRLRSADAAAPVRSAPAQRGPGEGALWPLSAGFADWRPMTASPRGRPMGRRRSRPMRPRRRSRARRGQPLTSRPATSPAPTTSSCRRPVATTALAAARRSRGPAATAASRSASRRGPGAVVTAAAPARRRAPPAPRPSHPCRRRNGFDYDRLLDALSFIGEGRAERIRSLLSGAEVDPWTPSEALRTLSALGHLEARLDRQLRPASWTIVPATVVLGEGEPFLAGFRGERLLYELGNATELRYEPQHDAPTRVLLPGLTREDADRLAAGLALPLHVAEDPARALASALPALPPLRAALPSLQGPPQRGPVERLEGNRWRPAELLGAERRLPHEGDAEAGLAPARQATSGIHPTSRPWCAGSASAREQSSTVGPDGRRRVGGSAPGRRGSASARLVLAGEASRRNHGHRFTPRSTRRVPARLAEDLLAAMTGERMAARV